MHQPSFHFLRLPSPGCVRAVPLQDEHQPFGVEHVLCKGSVATGVIKNPDDSMFVAGVFPLCNVCGIGYILHELLPRPIIPLVPLRIPGALEPPKGSQGQTLASWYSSSEKRRKPNSCCSMKLLTMMPDPFVLVAALPYRHLPSSMTAPHWC